MGLSEQLKNLPTSAIELEERDYVKAAKSIGCNPAVLKAVAFAETRFFNTAFWGNPPHPQLEFYPNQFRKHTNQKFDMSHPALSCPLSAVHKLPIPLHWERFQEAFDLSPAAAVSATCWGLFKVPGHRILEDYTDPITLVRGYHIGATTHIGDFVRVVEMLGAGKYLISREWSEFAKRYNPTGWVQNKYDAQIRLVYKQHAS